MAFRDDCKVEVPACKLSPQVWRTGVSILRVSNGETLLARTTVCELTNTYRSTVSALEVARAYAEAMIISGEFDYSPVLS